MDRLGNIAARHNILKETRMSNLPQPFSAAGNAHFAAQLQLFQTFTSQAVATTGKIINLNLTTARTSLEQSTEALRQVLGLGWTYIIVAELIGASSGIGHMITNSQ
eukprot:gene19912-39464_t